MELVAQLDKNDEKLEPQEVAESCPPNGSKISHAVPRQTNSVFEAPGAFPEDWDEPTLDEEDTDGGGELQQFLPQQRNVFLAQGPRSIRKLWFPCGRRQVLLMYSVLYFAIILIFAGVMYPIGGMMDDCWLGIAANYTNAFLFSSITITTVGYGSYSLFFNGCAGVTIVITVEILVGFMMNAFLLGLMYTKCARGATRKYSVRFSEKVMIRQIRGQWYFMFRVCEMRHSQILEAHIRCYCIRDETEAEMLNAGRSVPFMFQQYPMHLSHPDDDLGAPMLLMLPSTVVHRIDFWSPLSHRNFLYIPTSQYDPMNGYKWPDKRGSMTAVETEGVQFTCEFCGEAYRSKALLHRHIRINAAYDANSGYEEEGATPSMMKTFHVWPHWPDAKDSDASDSEGDRSTDDPNDPLLSPKTKSGVKIVQQLSDLGLPNNSCDDDSRSASNSSGDEDGESASSKSPTPRSSLNAKRPQSGPNLPVDQNIKRRLSLLDAVSAATVAKSFIKKPRNTLPSIVRKKLPPVLRHGPRNAAELKEQLSAFQNCTILVLLEGVDPNASCTLQCRKVYSLKDFVFSHDFAPCTIAEDHGRCTIDFGEFDNYMAVPDDPEVPMILRHK